MQVIALLVLFSAHTVRAQPGRPVDPGSPGRMVGRGGPGTPGTPGMVGIPAPGGGTIVMPGSTAGLMAALLAGAGYASAGGAAGGGTFPGAMPTICKFDAATYMCRGGCSLTMAIPFMRLSPVSCEECQAACQSNMNATSVYNCKALVYDNRYETCDIYAVSAQGYYKLTEFQSRDYCEVVGTGGGGDKPEVCPAGEVPKFLLTEDFSTTDPPVATLPIGQDECIEACKTNMGPDMMPFDCQSFVVMGNMCEIRSNSAEPTGTLVLAPTPGKNYVEKRCFPEASVMGCNDVFFRAPQYTLVGFATEELNAGSFEECFDACLASPNCRSGMFYYDTIAGAPTCLLNDMNRGDQPDLYGPDEFGDLVDYFEPDCPNRRRRPVASRPRPRQRTPSFTKQRASQHFDPRGGAPRRTTQPFGSPRTVGSRFAGIARHRFSGVFKDESEKELSNGAQASLPESLLRRQFQPFGTGSVLGTIDVPSGIPVQPPVHQGIQLRFRPGTNRFKSTTDSDRFVFNYPGYVLTDAEKEIVEKNFRRYRQPGPAPPQIATPHLPSKLQPKPAFDMYRDYATDDPKPTSSGEDDLNVCKCLKGSGGARCDVGLMKVKKEGRLSTIYCWNPIP